MVICSLLVLLVCHLCEKSPTIIYEIGGEEAERRPLLGEEERAVRKLTVIEEEEEEGVVLREDWEDGGCVGRVV